MARGVQEIAAPQLGRTAYCHDLAERVALHVGVAQYNDAEIAERVLHQPRAVEPEKVRAAPQIRAAEIAFGSGDEIGGVRRLLGQAAERHEFPGVEPRILAATGHDPALGDDDCAVPRQKIGRRRFHIGLGVNIGAHRRDNMRRFCRLADRPLAFVDIADIAVFERLAPGPAAGFLEDKNRLAIMVIGVERRLGSRRATDRDASGDNPRRPALDKAPRGHAPAQPRIGQILAIGIEPRVERH